MKKAHIAVIDYGMGNLRSVAKALELVGARVTVTGEPKTIAKADAVVFPGVGSFGPAVEYIKRRGLMKAIAEVIEQERLFLGLCLGFQLLFETSDEEGSFKGLGIVPGDVVRFSFKGRDKALLKIPHMGWNNVAVADKELKKTMFNNIPDNSYFYFVHSYYGRPREKQMVAATTEYGVTFCSAIRIGRTWACQFHPEKSGETGLQLLSNFVHEVKK